jgi:hypothetical protein
MSLPPPPPPTKPPISTTTIPPTELERFRKMSAAGVHPIAISSAMRVAGYDPDVLFKNNTNNSGTITPPQPPTFTIIRKDTAPPSVNTNNKPSSISNVYLDNIRRASMLSSISSSSSSSSATVPSTASLLGHTNTDGLNTRRNSLLEFDDSASFIDQHNNNNNTIKQLRRGSLTSSNSTNTNRSSSRKNHSNTITISNYHITDLPLPNIKFIFAMFIMTLFIGYFAVEILKFIESQSRHHHHHPHQHRNYPSSSSTHGRGGDLSSYYYNNKPNNNNNYREGRREAFYFDGHVYHKY